MNKHEKVKSKSVVALSGFSPKRPYGFFASAQNDKVRNVAGRSMIEMLGVLAIIGVLSIGGLAGYKIAMNYHRANETIHDVMLRATNVPMKWDDYATKTKDYVFAFNDMGAYKTNNPVGYPVVVKSEGPNSASGYAFRVEVSGVPSEVCKRINNMNPPAVDKIEPLASGCGDATANMTFYFDENFKGTGSDDTLNPENPTPTPDPTPATCDESQKPDACHDCVSGVWVSRCIEKCSFCNATSGECEVEPEPPCESPKYAEQIDGCYTGECKCIEQANCSGYDENCYCKGCVQYTTDNFIVTGAGSLGTMYCCSTGCLLPASCTPIYWPVDDPLKGSCVGCPEGYNFAKENLWGDFDCGIECINDGNCADREDGKTVCNTMDGGICVDPCYNSSDYSKCYFASGDEGVCYGKHCCPLYDTTAENDVCRYVIASGEPTCPTVFNFPDGNYCETDEVLYGQCLSGVCTQCTPIVGCATYTDNCLCSSCQAENGYSSDGQGGCVYNPCYEDLNGTPECSINNDSTNDGVCVASKCCLKVENCASYQTSCECASCEGEYVLSGNKCGLCEAVDGCLEYADATDPCKCTKCDTDYTLTASGGCEKACEEGQVACGSGTDTWCCGEGNTCGTTSGQCCLDGACCSEGQTRYCKTLDSDYSCYYYECCSGTVYVSLPDYPLQPKECCPPGGQIYLHQNSFYNCCTDDWVIEGNETDGYVCNPPADYTG